MRSCSSISSRSRLSRSILGCGWNPSGTVVIPRVTRSSVSRVTAVSALQSSPAQSSPTHSPPSASCRDLRGAAAHPPVGFLVAFVDGALHRLTRRAIHHALGLESLGVAARRGDVLRDRPVQDRLREGRVVHLVVAVFAIAHQVHQDVAVEARPELHGQRASRAPRPRGRRR